MTKLGLKSLKFVLQVDRNKLHLKIEPIWNRTPTLRVNAAITFGIPAITQKLHYHVFVYSTGTEKMALLTMLSNVSLYAWAARQVT